MATLSHISIWGMTLHYVKNYQF